MRAIDRGRAIGTWAAYASLTAASGPVLGGWLVEHASWRWVFFINLPLAGVVLAIALWKVPGEQRRRQHGAQRSTGPAPGSPPTASAASCTG